MFETSADLNLLATEDGEGGRGVAGRRRRPLLLLLLQLVAGDSQVVGQQVRVAVEEADRSAATGGAQTLAAVERQTQVATQNGRLQVVQHQRLPADVATRRQTNHGRV